MRKILVVLMAFLVLVGCGSESSIVTIDELLSPLKNKVFVSDKLTTPEHYDESITVEELNTISALAFDKDLKTTSLAWVGLYDGDINFKTDERLLENNFVTEEILVSEKFTMLEGTEFFTSDSVKNDLMIFSVYKIIETDGKYEIHQYALGGLLGLNDFKHDVKLSNFPDMADELNAVDVHKKEFKTYIEFGEFELFSGLKRTLIDDIEVVSFDLGFDAPFTFRGIDYVISDISGWTSVDNRFSDLDGKDVFKLPVKFTNNNKEPDSLNMFSYTIYGPSGSKLSSVSSYVDGEIDYYGDILPGATAESFFAVLYEGDGEYQIHFDSYAEPVVFKFNVEK